MLVKATYCNNTSNNDQLNLRQTFKDLLTFYQLPFLTK